MDPGSLAKGNSDENIFLFSVNIQSDAEHAFELKDKSELKGRTIAHIRSEGSGHNPKAVKQLAKQAIEGVAKQKGSIPARVDIVISNEQVRITTSNNRNAQEPEVKDTVEKIFRIGSDVLLHLNEEEAVEGVQELRGGISFSTLPSEDTIKRVESFSESYRRHAKKYKEEHKKFQLLWKAIVCPILALNSRLKQTKVTQVSRTLAGSFVDSLNNDFQGFISILEESKFIIDPKNTNSEESEVLSQAIEWGKQVAQAKGNVSKVQDLTKQHAAHLIEKLRTKDAVISIPGGSWNEGRFEPFLLTFTRKDGDIRIHQYAASSAQNTAAIASWKVSSADWEELASKHQLGNLLSYIYLSATSTASELTKEERKRLENIRKLYPSFGVPIQTSSSAESQERPFLASFRILIETRLGAQPNEDPDNMLESTYGKAKGAWGIVGEFLHTSFPEISSSEKTILVIQRLNLHVKILLEKLDGLSNNERKQVLGVILKDYERAKRQLDKLLGKEGAFDELVQSDELYRILEENIRKFQSEYSQIEIDQKADPSQKREVAFQKKSDSFSIKAAPFSEASEVSSSSQLKQFSIDRKDVESKIQSVKTAIEQTKISGNIPKPEIDRKNSLQAEVSEDYLAVIDKTYVVLQDAASLLNQVVEEGNYELAIQMGKELLLSLPIPSPGGPRTGEPTSFWNYIPQEDIPKWTHLLNNVSHYFWEAKLHYGDGHLWPDEAIGMASAEAVIVKLIRERGRTFINSTFLNKLREALDEKNKKPKIDESEFHPMFKGLFDSVRKVPPRLGDVEKEFKRLSRHNPEELGYLCKQLEIPLDGLYDALYYVSNYAGSQELISSLIYHDPYVISLDAEQHQKVSSLHYFYHNLNTTYKVTDGSGSEELCLLSLVSWDGNNNGEEEFKVLSTKCRRGFISSKPPQSEPKQISADDSDYKKTFSVISEDMQSKNEPYVSSTLLDFRRTHLMGLSLLHPEASLYLHFHGIQGKIKAVKWFESVSKQAVQEAKESPELFAKKVCDIQQRDLHIRLKHMGRLEFSITDSIIDNEPVIQVISQRKTRSSADDGLFLQIKPIQLPEELNLKVPDTYNSGNGREVVGNLPEVFSITHLGTTDGSLHELVAKGEGSIAKQTVIRETKDRMRTEFSALKEGKKAGNPIEHLILGTLRTTNEDNHLDTDCVLFALEALIQYPEKLSEDTWQQALESAIFRPPYLLRFLETNPSFVKHLIPEIRALIEQAVTQNNIKAASFLLHISSQIRLFADYILFEANKEKFDLSEAKKAEKAANSTPLTLDELRRKNSNGEMIEDGTLEKLAPYILLSQRGLEQIKLKIQDLMDIQREMPSYLDDFKDKAEQPKQALKKLIEWSLSDSPEAMQSAIFLFEALKLRNSLEIASISWEEFSKKEDSSPLADLSEKDKKQIEQIYGVVKDLPLGIGIGSVQKGVMDWAQSTLFTEKHLNELAQSISIPQPLPKAIKQHPTFSKLFGNMEMQAEKTTKGSSLHESIYEATLPNQSKVYFIYDRETDALNIELEPILPLDRVEKGEPSRLRWRPFTGESLKNTEILLEQTGLWSNPKNPQEGWVILDNLHSEKLSSYCRVGLKKDGSIDSILTQDRKFVALDRRGDRIQWFSCFPSQNILFLKDEKNGEISEIRILGTQLAFRKNEDNTWQINGGVLDKFLWAKEVFHRNEEDTSNDSISPSMQRFLNIFRDDWKHFGIALRGDNSEKLLIVPQQIIKDQSSTPGKSQLDFIQDEIEVGDPLSILQIQMDHKGIRSSCAGFLYIAYAAAMEKKYDEATYFLQEAKKNRLTQQEIELFNSITSWIEQFPADSLRAKSFLLKARIAILDIKRQQLADTGFSPDNATEFLTQAIQLSKFYESYQKQVETSRHTRLGGDALASELLALTMRERQDLALIHEQALRCFLASKPKAPQNSEPIKFSAAVFQALDKNFITYLSIYGDFSSKVNVPDIRSVTSLSSDNMLKYFPHFWNQIIELKSQPESTFSDKDLENLMGSIVLREGEDAGVKDAIIKARDLLLTLACDKFKFDSGDASRILFYEGVLTQMKQAQSRIYSSHSNSTNFIRDAWNTWKRLRLGSAITGVDEKIGEIRKKCWELFKEEQIEQKKKKPQQLGLKVDLNKIESLLEDSDDPRLSPQERILYKECIDRLKDEARDGEFSSEEVKNELPLTVMLKIALENHISLVGIRREEALSKRIEARILEIRGDIESKEQTATFAEANEQVFENGWLTEWQETVPFQDVQEDSIRSLEEFRDDAQSELEAKIEDVNPLKKMIEQDLADHKKGVELAISDLITEAKSRVTLSKDKVAGALSALEARRKSIQSDLNVLGENLLEEMRNPSAPLKIKQIIKQHALQGDLYVLDQLLHLYQTDQLNGLSEDITEKITRYCLLSIENKQLERGLGKLQEVQKLYEQIELRKSSQDEDSTKALQRQIDDICSEIRRLIDRGSDYSRYKELSESLRRKCLVTEVRREIVLRPQQIELLGNIIQEPNQLLQLRMGMGKTSYILPIAMQMLAEQGMLPMALVTQELFAMNRQELDVTTRELFEQAAYHLSINEKVLSDSTSIAQEVDRLLEVKQQKGYVITTIEQLASIQNRLTEIDVTICELLQLPVWNKSMPSSEDLIKKLQQIESLEDLFDETQKIQLFELQKQRYWLCMLQEVLQSNSQGPFGFRTQYFADEGDDIFAINREVNKALGGNKSPEPIVCNMTSKLFKVIMSDSIQQEDVVRLRTALMSNKQSFLNESTVRNAMKHVAKHLLTDILNQEVSSSHPILQWIEASIDQQKASLDIESLELSEDQKPIIAALKHLVSDTAPNNLGLSLDIDMGIQKKDSLRKNQSEGCIVVPKKDGEEKPNTQYSDEYQLIFNHYLLYAVKGPSNEFLSKCIRWMKVQNPVRYEELEIAERESGQSVIDLLKSPERWHDRIDLLEEYVINSGRLTMTNKQSTLNVQDSMRGRNCGAASGTINPYSLLEGFKTDPKREDSRRVEGETLVKLGIGKNAEGKPQTLGAVAEVVKDTEILQGCADRLSNPNVKSIINLGFSIQGRNSLEIIRYWRGTEQGKDRQFIFVNPNNRQAYMWNPGENEEPIPFSKDLLNKDTCLFYFDPADKRGTDFPIPPGGAYFIPGATTTTEQFAQGVWRLRQLGTLHTAKALVPSSLAERIRSEQDLGPDSNVTLGHIYRDIELRTVRTQSEYNLKAARLHIQGLATTKLRDAMYSVQQHQKDREYWSVPKDEDLDSKMVFDMLLTETIFSAVATTFRFIEDKQIDFEQEFKDASLVDTLSLLEKECDAEIKKIDDFLLGILGELSATISGAVYSKKVSQENYKKFREFCLSISRNLTNAKKQLKAKKQDFKVQREYHEKNLPSLSPKIENRSGGEAQVTQQQQQQQMQMTSEVESGKEDIDVVHRFEPFEIMELSPTSEVQKLRDMQQAFDIDPALAKHLPQTCFSSPEICAILKELPKYQGDGIAHIVINKNKGDNAHRIILLSKNDYKFIQASRQIAGIPKGTIYTIDRAGSIIGDKRTSLGLTPVLQYGNEGIKDLEDDIGNDVVILKLLLGYTHFTEKEKELLKNWLLIVKEDKPAFEALKTFIRNNSSAQLSKLIFELSKA